MSSALNLSVSPHIRSSRTTRGIMLDVIIALLPVTVAGTVIFGLRSLAVVAVCVISAVAAEFIFNLIVKKEQTIGDLSAVVTGLLLALNMSVNVPFWQAAVGSLFAIVVVKCIFGGLGCNIVNPAVTARVFMLIAFSSMANYSYPVDAVSSATPLSLLANDQAVELKNLFLGTTGGAIGETCTLALLIGGIYLLVRKVITWHIPVSFIGTAFILSFLLDGFDAVTALSWILSGGLFLGAIFMATDYVTSPASAGGKIIFGIVGGLFTVLIRFFAAYPEGVSFAILLCNIINPYIDAHILRKVFGGAKK